MKYPFDIIVLLSIVIFIITSCETLQYTTSQQDEVALHTILDPNEDIEGFYFFSKGINELVELEKTLYEVSLYENDNELMVDTSSTGFFSFPYKPIPEKKYKVVMSVFETGALMYESLSYEVLDNPIIEAICIQDSIRPINPISQQVFQKIDLQVDTSFSFFPYFFYSVKSDTSAFFDFKDTIQTHIWSVGLSERCPEIAEAVFFGGSFDVVNLSCRENQGFLSFGASTHNPNEFEYMDFEICMVDEQSINLMRQLFQDGLHQVIGEDFVDQVLAILLTKDDFDGNIGYDFIVNRACSKIRVDL